MDHCTCLLLEGGVDKRFLQIESRESPDCRLEGGTETSCSHAATFGWRDSVGFWLGASVTSQPDDCGQDRLHQKSTLFYSGQLLNTMIYKNKIK